MNWTTNSSSLGDMTKDVGDGKARDMAAVGECPTFGFNKGKNAARKWES